MSKRIVIVGGVAGGMSCAARIKRLDDSAEVTVFEKGNDVSFANCGMPYYIGGVIEDRENMLVVTPEGLVGRYGLDVRTRHEVVRIDRDAKQVEVKNLESGETFTQEYDYLVLSPGAAPLRPPIPGAAGPRVHVLNDLADMDAIHESVAASRHAVVVGAGFIGLEMVENLRHKGVDVTLVEMLDQVMPPMDWEMTQPLAQELRLHGVDLRLETTVDAIDEAGRASLSTGETLDSDLVILSVGVRPTSQLAKEAGIDLGARSHIKVDDHMRTNDPAVFAVGDAVEVRNFMGGFADAVPLAGPANRQGRIAADNICGRDSAYRDTQGTAIVKLFNLAAAGVGLNEKRLQQLGWEYERVFVHPMQRPKYYPDAKPLATKLLFSPEGRIYGAQVVGQEGVDMMIDVFATAQRAGMTVEDLEHLELAYSPQWGGAKHPVNMAGFAAANILRGDAEQVEAEDAAEDVFWLDVRQPEETEAGVIPGAAVIPLGKLRQRVDELPRDKEIRVYCQQGLRGYVAYRFLKQQGFNVRNLNGGYRTWCWHQCKDGAPPAGCCDSGPEEADCTHGSARDAREDDRLSQADDRLSQADDHQSPALASQTVFLDVCGLQCPGPIAQVKRAIQSLAPGQVLEVKASDPGFASDIPAWCERTGHKLIEVAPEDGNYVARLAKRGDNAPAAQAIEKAVHPTPSANGKTMVCFSDDLDRAMATFIIANGAAAMESEVTLFFTFWGLNILRKEQPPRVRKGLLDRMFGWMMPRGPKRLTLSKMNMGGMGTRMMQHVMRSKNVMSLEELIQSARDNGVRLVACSMSMDVMGIHKEELIDGVEIGGVAHFLGASDKSNMTLFI